MADIIELYDEGADMGRLETLESYVLGLAQRWRDHYKQTYEEKHREYYRIWRGEHSEEDRDRKSEKSNIITPGSMQAVEENSAEVEEATFTGRMYDLRDDLRDEAAGENLDIAALRRQLDRDLAKAKVQPAISECITIAAVYGSGQGEIVIEEKVQRAPATQPSETGSAVQIGVVESRKLLCTLQPELPQNFLVDPNATSPHNGHGVIIDKYVGQEKVVQLQEQGVYANIDIGTESGEWELEPTQELTIYQDDRVRLTKYFGLVPRHLLVAAQDRDIPEDASVVELAPDDDDSYYVEAIVILGNGHLLKAEANPYMMQDRPVVSFQWDVVPGRYWGRGVIEKAYNTQKAVDAEIRARIDALALTIHPMMAIDATRLPRGSKPQVRPGKMLRLQGNPQEILHPFKFGEVSQITFAQAEALQKMLQQATGAINGAGMPAGAASGEARTGAVVATLGAAMKRHKRTLLSFQSCFLLPMIEKMAWRYMQFDPENYPIGDYTFHAEGSLGLVAREYEVSQLVHLLQTMSPESPLYPTLLRSIVDNMSLSNREELLAELAKAMQPDEAKQQMEQQRHEAEMQVQNATFASLQASADEDAAHAELYRAQAANLPMENRIALARVAAFNQSPDDNTGDKEFEKRLRILGELRADRELSIKEREATAKERLAAAEAKSEQEMRNRLNAD